MEDQKTSSTEQGGERKTIRFILTAFAILGMLVILLAAKSVLANSAVGKSVNEANYSGSSKLTLNVDIPCPGHASRIIYEVEKLDGINDVKFRLPSLFDVYYNPDNVSQKDILALDIFKEFRAKVQ